MSIDREDPPSESLGVVLVVDDEPRIRSLARRFLEDGAYQVIEAENGAEALKVMEGGTPIDFLMVDLDMPVMRGDEMATRMRAARPDLKVLYVTAHVDSLFEKRPQLWEGEAFLDKPFTKKGLLEAVSLLRWGTFDGTPPSHDSSLRLRWQRLWDHARGITLASK